MVVSSAQLRQSSPQKILVQDNPFTTSRSVSSPHNTKGRYYQQALMRKTRGKANRRQNGPALSFCTTSIIFLLPRPWSSVAVLQSTYSPLINACPSVNPVRPSQRSHRPSARPPLPAPPHHPTAPTPQRAVPHPPPSPSHHARTHPPQFLGSACTHTDTRARTPARIRNAHTHTCTHTHTQYLRPEPPLRAAACSIPPFQQLEPPSRSGGGS